MESGLDMQLAWSGVLRFVRLSESQELLLSAHLQGSKETHARPLKYERLYREKPGRIRPCGIDLLQLGFQPNTAGIPFIKDILLISSLIKFHSTFLGNGGLFTEPKRHSSSTRLSLGGSANGEQKCWAKRFRCTWWEEEKMADTTWEVLLID